MPTMQTIDAGPATFISEPETLKTVEAGSSENGGSQIPQIPQIPQIAQIALAVQPPPDPVRLTALNVDFGAGTFVQGVPSAFGMLTWDLLSGTVEPRLTGTLYMNGSLGREAKMQMRFFDVFDNLLANKTDGSVTPSSNGLEEWSVDMAPYANNAIYRVEVSILVHYTGNSWWIYDRDSYTI